MGWEIVLFLIALACGLKFGVKAVWSGIKNRHEANVERRAHKARLVKEAIEAGMAPREAKVAAAAATRAAVTVSAWVAAWLAWKNGWGEGWGYGHKRGAELRDGTTIHDGNDVPQQEIHEEDDRGDDKGQNDLLNPKSTPALPNQAAHCALHFDADEAEYRRLRDSKLCVRELAYKECPVGHKIPVYCGVRVTGEGTALCVEHQTAPPLPSGETSGAAAGKNSEKARMPQETRTCDCAGVADSLYRSYVNSGSCVFNIRTETLSCGHSVPTLCGNPEAEKGTARCQKHQPKTEREKENMAIETGAVSGEILTKQQFESAMKAIISEEAAEIEDANGDLKRAEEHSKQVELMAASLASAQIDADTIAAVKQFLDGSSTRMSDAQQRVANADLRKTAAENALATLQASRQNQFYSA